MVQAEIYVQSGDETLRGGRKWDFVHVSIKTRMTQLSVVHTVWRRVRT